MAEGEGKCRFLEHSMGNPEKMAKAGRKCRFLEQSLDSLIYRLLIVYINEPIREGIAQRML